MRIKTFALLAALTLAHGLPGTAFAGGFGLKPVKDYAWWAPGESVTFKVAEGTLPPELALLKGRVCDVEGKARATVEVSREGLMKQGWEWKPSEPGFYEVEFSWSDAAGKQTQVSESFTLQAPNGTKASFERAKLSIAVVESAPRNAKRTGQFGWQYHLKQNEIPLAALVGFDFTMIHSIPWGAHFTKLTSAIQPEAGVFDWSGLDADVQALSQAGFEIGGQFCYTPLWASPHPELRDKINICVREASAYAPVKMEDFTHFVEKTVERYKDKIRIWEIWNEPNLPGASCFWSDTPENYVRLLKAGHDAIKKVQPEAEVWNGGIAGTASYLAFYDRVLRLGGEPYHDHLSLHGRDVDLEKFRKVATANNVALKPSVNSEWHAILVGNLSDGNKVTSEEALSLRMMKSQLNQIKQGVVRTAIFEMSNLVEIEAIPFASSNKWFVHSAGLFRLRPRMEPRHPAVVMANFLNVTGKEARFAKEIRVGQDGIGIVLETGKGKLLAFWSERSAISFPDLRAYAASHSELHDWEGKTLSLAGGGALATGKLYYLSAPSDAALAQAESTDVLVPVDRVQRSSASGPSAFYGPDAPWIAKDWKWVPVMEKAQASLSARAKVGANAKGIDFVVEVKDAKHSQSEDSQWWNADSLQIAVDCEGRGAPGENAEILAALKPDGVVFWKMKNANAGADLPSRRSLDNSPVEFGDCKITREYGLTTYRLHLEWSELYPLVYQPGRPLRIAMVVNNNNGKKREGYLEWASGIGEQKDPARYGTLHPMGGK